MIYAGPDPQHQGSEICFAANEDTLTIVDVTEKANPQQISRTGYAGDGYTHQVWLSEDHTLLFLDDELDERNFGHGTMTRTWDVGLATQKWRAPTATSPEDTIQAGSCRPPPC